MTNQSKTIFTAIIILALMATGATWLVERLSYYTLPTRGGISTSIEVAVSPKLFEWVQAAATDFNDSNSQITVTVTEVDSKRIDSALGAGIESLPDVWIPEAGFVAQQNGSATYNRSGESVASDKLLWAKPANQPYALDWQMLHDAAVNDRQFNIALPSANNTTAIATCLSAANTFHQTTELDFALANDSALKAWFNEIRDAIPNQTDPYAQLVRRPPAIDVVMITASEGVELNADFETASPLFDITFDYPYVTRSTWAELSADDAAAKQTAVDRFFEALNASSAQSDLAAYGLSPALSLAVEGETTFNSRVIQALQWCWQ
ncbi:MAG: hypothetical protein ACI9EW_000493 [Cellvibrionaceae bacterium]|jgi:hypothetical protein